MNFLMTIERLTRLYARQGSNLHQPSGGLARAIVSYAAFQLHTAGLNAKSAL